MKKRRSNLILLLIFVLIILLFIATGVFAAKRTIAAEESKVLSGQTETPVGVDFVAMQEFSGKNSQFVFKALKSGKVGSLKKIMIDPEGAEAIMEFADWSNADFENAVSLGAGSLTEGPDALGRQDINEKFFVRSGDDKYVLFIETVTSRLGRKNDGISAVSVIPFSDFDEVEFVWNGEDENGGVLAGKLFWKED